MTAEEARLKTKEANTNQGLGQLFKITEMISNAVSKGEYSIFFYDSIRNDVKNKLVEMGYNVGQSSERNESVIKISWE